MGDILTNNQRDIQIQWYTNMLIVINHPNSLMVDNRGQHQ